eukprot:CAMPEP_0170555576 /NCGR_PEP_ID=MMETSP0211-20121228/13476_1 /TAXON_ID=311385 /ORGANISM="Pseudokeronopsis sp., Strain OXSARD2" /LENGTH=34 /DNA_ID= /DNA_START= /DNA_END= /DNA_ORIENTATION=
MPSWPVRLPTYYRNSWQSDFDFLNTDENLEKEDP